MFLICNFWLIFFKTELKEANEGPDEIMVVYKNIWSVMKTPHMSSFILILLLSKIGFIANEQVSGLKLLEFGFDKEDLALSVLVDFPFQVFS